MNRVAHRFPLIGLFLLIPCLVLTLLAVPITQASEDAPYAALLAKAQTKGHVRLVVELALPYQPEGELLTMEAVRAQRLSIAHAQASLIQELNGLNVRVMRTYNYIPYLALKGDEAVLRALRANPAVSNITEDRSHRVALAQSTGIIGAKAAWKEGFTGKGWKVAILDTGVSSSHRFLAKKVVAEACFSTNDEESAITSVCPNRKDTQIGREAARPCSDDGCEHGTHVAGIAAGKGTRFSGVAKGATIIAVQVFSRIEDTEACDGEPTCTTAQDSDILAGMEYVYSLRKKYKIASLNMSLGGEAYSSIRNCNADALDYKRTIAILRKAGIATVIASGNEEEKSAIGSPACVTGAISVGATDDDDEVADFSNSAPFLSLLAPGVGITSSVLRNKFAAEDGTSMATPHVAGAWAVLKQAAPKASVSKLLAVLQETGEPVVDVANNIETPRIQIDAALEALLEDTNLATATDDAIVIWPNDPTTESAYRSPSK